MACASTHRKRCRAVPRNASPKMQTKGTHGRRVLMLGGTGRVGLETVKALVHQSEQPLDITLGGRNVRYGEQICTKLSRETSRTRSDVAYKFEQVDIKQPSCMRDIIAQHDLVIHSAGPFQRCGDATGVLRAAMAENVSYMDVCDDVTHAQECKKLDESACLQNYTALICTGVYPGLSNLMAIKAVEELDCEHFDSLKLFYHTTGTGGIGATVLATTFLMLSDAAVCFDSSGKVLRLPTSQPEVFDFSGGIGARTTYVLNFPEVTSLFENLEAEGAEVCAKFCTGPPVWNWLLQRMAKWVPNEILRNSNAMRMFAKFSLPVVRAVDLISGARTGIVVLARVGDKCVKVCFEHERLATCVGEATAAFAVELMKRGEEDCEIQNGVLYPEQLMPSVRERVSRNATSSADLFDISLVI